MASKKLTKFPSSKVVKDVIKEIQDATNLSPMFKEKYIDLINADGLKHSGKLAREFKKDLDIIAKGGSAYKTKKGIVIANPKDIVNELKAQDKEDADKEKLEQAYQNCIDMFSAAADGIKDTAQGVLSGDNDKFLSAVLGAMTGALNLFGKSVTTAVTKAAEYYKNRKDKKRADIEYGRIADGIKENLSDTSIDEPKPTEDEIKAATEEINKNLDEGNKVTKDEAADELSEYDGVTPKDEDEAYNISILMAKKVFGDSFDQAKFDGMFYGLKDRSESIGQLMGMVRNSLRGFGPRSEREENSDGMITNWDEARDYAVNRLKVIFGDKYDDKIAQSMVDGLMEKYPDNPAVVVGAINRHSNSRYSDFTPGGTKAMDAHGNKVVLIGVKDFPSEFPLVGIVYDIDGGFFYPYSYNYQGQDWHAAEPKGSSEYYTMYELWKWDKSIINKLPKMSEKEYDSLTFDRKLDRYFNSDSLTKYHIVLRKCKKTGELWIEVIEGGELPNYDNIIESLSTESLEILNKELSKYQSEYSIPSENVEYSKYSRSLYTTGYMPIPDVIQVKDKSGNEVSLIGIYKDKLIGLVTNGNFQEMAEFNKSDFNKLPKLPNLGEAEYKDIRVTKYQSNGKCPETGCIKQDEEGNWRIISNKTGEYWKAKYKSEDSAKAALKAYHARNSNVENSDHEIYVGRYPDGDRSYYLFIDKAPINDDEIIYEGTVIGDNELDKTIKKLVAKYNIDTMEIYRSNSSNKSMIAGKPGFMQMINSKVSQIAPKILKLEKEFPDWNITFDTDDGVIEFFRHDYNMTLDSGNEKFILSGPQGVLFTTNNIDKLIAELKNQLK